MVKKPYINLGLLPKKKRKKPRKIGAWKQIYDNKYVGYEWSNGFNYVGVWKKYKGWIVTMGCPTTEVTRTHKYKKDALQHAKRFMKQITEVRKW